MASESPPTQESQSNATKRPRPVISCLECRRKKLKCDRSHPCQQCLKIGRPGRCQYQRGSEPETNGGLSPAAQPKRPRLDFNPVAENQESSFITKKTPNETTLVQPKPGIIEDLQDRVAKLEKALISQSGRPATTSNDHALDTTIGNSDGDEGQDLLVNSFAKPLVSTHVVAQPAESNLTGPSFRPLARL